MGMYDEFILKTPIQCTNCNTGSYCWFQTKDLNNTLDQYFEGEPAVQYALRKMTVDEIAEQDAKDHTADPDGIDLIFNGFPRFVEDKSVVRSKLSDGYYMVYEYCKNCNKLFYVYAVVKDGIFIGVKPITEK